MIGKTSGQRGAVCGAYYEKLRENFRGGAPVLTRGVRAVLIAAATLLVLTVALHFVLIFAGLLLMLSGMSRGERSLSPVPELTGTINGYNEPRWRFQAANEGLGGRATLHAVSR